MSFNKIMQSSSTSWISERELALSGGHGGVKAQRALFARAVDNFLIGPRIESGKKAAKERSGEDTEQRYSHVNHSRCQIAAISAAAAMSKWVCSMSFKANSWSSRLREPTQSFKTTVS